MLSITVKMKKVCFRLKDTGDCYEVMVILALFFHHYRDSIANIHHGFFKNTIARVSDGISNPPSKSSLIILIFC